MTDIRPLEISFTDSPQEEVALIQREFGLGEAAAELEKAIVDGQMMSEEAHMKLAELLAAFQDMFSLDLPSLGETTEETLRLSSRDINLSRLLRERGLIRLYRLLKEEDEEGVPLYLGYMDPYTDSPFSTKEDFIGWVAKDAHIPRSTLFMRFATYDKMLGVGFDLEESFRTVITKPYAMREVLNMIAEWDRGGKISGVDPQIVQQVAGRILPRDRANVLAALAEKYKENPSSGNLKNLVDSYTPVIREFIQELAEHENVKDMMEYVRHDVLAQPEITYTWRDEALILRVVRKAVDDSGAEVVIDVEDIPFVPDYPGRIDDEIVDDLLNRLPIKNRREVLLERERRELADKIGQEELPF